MEKATDDMLEPKFGSAGARLLGMGGPMRLMRKQISQLASTDDSVLIIGETGTGKELVARGLHFSGFRASKAFLKINCGDFANNPQLLRSELFGYVRGAFTGAVKDTLGILESAGDGTVFLDEIGEMPKDIQSSILRALENHEVRRVGDARSRAVQCRVIAATNKPRSERYGLREDLLYRFEVTLKTKPIRERKRDLVQYFLVVVDEYKTTLSAPDGVSLGMFLSILDYEWPGNYREVRSKVRDYLRNYDSDMQALGWFFIFESDEYFPGSRPQRLFKDEWLTVAKTYKLRFDISVWLSQVWISFDSISKWFEQINIKVSGLTFREEVLRFLGLQIKKSEARFLRQLKEGTANLAAFAPNLGDYTTIPSQPLINTVEHFKNEAPVYPTMLAAIQARERLEQESKEIKTKRAELGLMERIQARESDTQADQEAANAQDSLQNGKQQAMFSARGNESIDSVVKRFYEFVLKQNSGNYSRSARSLGIERATLRRWISEGKAPTHVRRQRT